MKAVAARGWRRYWIPHGSWKGWWGRVAVVRVAAVRMAVVRMAVVRMAVVRMAVVRMAVVQAAAVQAAAVQVVLSRAVPARVVLTAVANHRAWRARPSCAGCCCTPNPTGSAAGASRAGSGR